MSLKHQFRAQKVGGGSRVRCVSCQVKKKQWWVITNYKPSFIFFLTLNFLQPDVYLRIKAMTKKKEIKCDKEICKQLSTHHP